MNTFVSSSAAAVSRQDAVPVCSFRLLTAPVGALGRASVERGGSP